MALLQSTVSLDSFCGFVVVRKPEHNFDPSGRGAYSSTPPCVNDAFYCGIDRMPWFDIEEDLYSGAIDPSARERYLALRSMNDASSAIMTVGSLADAEFFLEYSNKRASANEIVAVFSTDLAKLKGSQHWPTLEGSWLGFDVLLLGHFSLIREGYYRCPQAFSSVANKIGAAGLLLDQMDARQYVEVYRAAADEGRIEELPDPSALVYSLAVFAIA